MTLQLLYVFPMLCVLLSLEIVLLCTNWNPAVRQYVHSANNSLTHLHLLHFLIASGGSGEWSPAPCRFGWVNSGRCMLGETAEWLTSQKISVVKQCMTVLSLMVGSFNRGRKLGSLKIYTLKESDSNHPVLYLRNLQESGDEPTSSN